MQLVTYTGFISGTCKIQHSICVMANNNHYVTKIS